MERKKKKSHFIGSQKLTFWRSWDNVTKHGGRVSRWGSPSVTDTTSRCIREVTSDNQVQSRCRSLTCFNTWETHWAKRSSFKWHLWWQRTDPTPPDFCLPNLQVGQCRNVPSSAVWNSTSLEVESNLSLNVQTCAETTHTLICGVRHSRYLINTRVVMVGKSETTSLAKCK